MAKAHNACPNCKTTSIPSNAAKKLVVCQMVIATGTPPGVEWSGVFDEDEIFFALCSSVPDLRERRRNRYTKHTNGKKHPIRIFFISGLITLLSLARQSQAYLAPKLC